MSNWLTVVNRILRRQYNENQIQRILLRFRVDRSLFQILHYFFDIVRIALGNHANGILAQKCDPQSSGFEYQSSAKVP